MNFAVCAFLNQRKFSSRLFEGSVNSRQYEQESMKVFSMKSPFPTS